MLEYFSFCRNATACDLPNVLKNRGSNVSDGCGPIQHAAGGEIKISRHAVEDVIVRSQLDHRSDRIADRGTTACGENHDGCSGCDQPWRRFLVITWALHQEQAPASG